MLSLLLWLSGQVSVELKRIGGALKNAVFQIFGLEAVFGPYTGETKKAAIMDFL
jgi:hypothetical protein